MDSFMGKVRRGTFARHFLPIDEMMIGSYI